MTNEEHAMTNEEHAIELSNNPTNLLACLREAKKVLHANMLPFFKQSKFDFEGKRLIGEGVCLQWKVRHCPDKPVNYKNQQTRNGTVVLKLYLAKQEDE